MTPTTEARSLERAANGKFARLGALLYRAVGLPPDRVRENLIAYITIEALSTWATFSRAYYVSCLYSTRLARGSRVKVTPPFAGRSELEALRWAVNRSRKRKLTTWTARDEPAWHSTSKLLDLCTDLNCSHIADVQAALSSPTRVFVDLPTYRNFFAHRNASTLRDAMSIGPTLGVPGTLRPAEALVYRPPTAPRGTLDQWLVDLQDVVTAMCA